jgi:hypothetical protein
MSDSSSRLEETVTLSQASQLIQAMAHQESLLLLSPPGVGKSDTVLQAARAAGLPCRSLLGTQIAPEDVSGVPRIVGERSVFCPPRVLLPESNEPFCLFLDELPACTPDIQKAFYSLLLERRIGEHHLPAGSWVVAAGNRVQDRALVRTISSALLNRVFVLNIRIDVAEWIDWARDHHLDRALVAYIQEFPDALLQPVPKDPVPFSTPRAWALLSEALSLGITAQELEELPLPVIAARCRALAGGRISADEVNRFTNWWIIASRNWVDLMEDGYWGVVGGSIERLPVAMRIIHLLENNETASLQSLVVRDRRWLLAHGFDALQVDEIEAALAAKGLWLGMQL